MSAPTSYTRAQIILHWVTFIAILPHIVGALYHRFVPKSGVVQRMSLHG